MCGVAGAINVPDATATIRMMLHAQQNRGQDAAGMVSFSDDVVYEHRSPGTVTTNFPDEVIDTLPGSIAIGHNRYATASNSRGFKNTQPFVLSVDGKPITIAHNGNFTNIADVERNQLRGTPFFSESDTERFFRLIIKKHRSNTLEQSTITALEEMQGSCSAVIATPDKLLAIRDSSGNRPLFWVRYEDGYLVASEPTALDAVDAQHWQEVEPGTLVSLSSTNEPVITSFEPKARKRFCPFELVYFGQITSRLYNIRVDSIRHDFGRALAKEHPVQAEIIAGIPDSGTLSGLGFAEANGYGSYEHAAIIRRHNTGRTFTRARQRSRENAVNEKFGFNSELILGKEIVLVDDSLVRGTTSKRITEELRKRGATKVHWRIPSPQVIGACEYGIATKSGELLATGRSNVEMARHVGADSLEFLSMEGFHKVITNHGVSPKDCCFACMDGNYW